MRRIIPVLVSALLCACGGSSSSTPANPTLQDSDEDWGDDWQWEDEAEAEPGPEEGAHRSAIEILGGINPLQPLGRDDLRGARVLHGRDRQPHSAEMIQEHDPNRGAGFNCHCHGSDMRERNLPCPVLNGCQCRPRYP